MSCSRSLCLTVFLLLAQAGMAEHVVGLGAEFDSEDNKAFSVFGSFAVAEKTWLSASAVRSNSDGVLFDLDTVYFDVSLDHHFDPLGLRFGAAYWGDPDLLDSVDLRAAAYWRNDRASVTIDVERRAFDLTLRTLLGDQERTVEFEADGIGASLRFDVTEDVSLYASGMSYDYSRDIALQPNIDVLRIFAFSSLSTINSLTDNRISGGLELNIGQRMLDFRVSSWKSAVFGDRVDSIGVGLLTPLGDASDIEFRLATDDSDTTGRATLLSFFLYFYGE